MLANFEFWDIRLVGYAAGFLLAASGLPKFIVNYKNSAAIDKTAWLHYSIIVIGNSLWVLFGVHIGEFPIVLFCSINAVMHAALLAQIMKNTKPNQQ